MVSLSKNQTVSLTKTASSTLTKLHIGLGWDPVEKKGLLAKLSGSKTSIDLDASCVLMDASAQELDVVYFGQLKSKCRSVVHHGDNLTGEGDGDDEVISVDLQRLPANVEILAVTVSSFRGQTFKEVDNAFCRVLDDGGKELARFDLREQGAHTSVLIASIRRQGGEWNFKAHGKPCTGRTIADILPVIRNEVR